MKKTSSSIGLAALAALAMSACGGGGDSGSSAAATDAVPASASASVSGFIDYLQALVKSAAETLEPVSVANVTPPASDNEEPRKLD